jgi:hypothetical protein
MNLATLTIRVNTALNPLSLSQAMPLPSSVVTFLFGDNFILFLLRDMDIQDIGKLYHKFHPYSIHKLSLMEVTSNFTIEEIFTHNQSHFNFGMVGIRTAKIDSNSEYNVTWKLEEAPDFSNDKEFIGIQLNKPWKQQ